MINEIDWEDWLDTYNRMCKRRKDMPGPFLTVDCMLFRLYQIEKSASRVGDIFGCSNTAVIAQLKARGIVVQRPGGWDKPKSKKLDELGREQIEDMTTKAMAVFAGCSVQCVHRYLKKHKLSYVKVRNTCRL